MGSEGNHEWRERQPVGGQLREHGKREKGGRKREGGSERERERERESLCGHPCQPGDGHFAKNFRFVCTR